jgi:hypothetical protein
MTSAKYRIYVRLKNGDQVGGRELYKGPPPASGTELEVPLLRGGTVKARIGSFHTEPGKRGGIAGTVVTATPSRLLLCRSSWADNARASH